MPVLKGRGFLDGSEDREARARAFSRPHTSLGFRLTLGDHPRPKFRDLSG
jgi:hypothetical protein